MIKMAAEFVGAFGLHFFYGGVAIIGRTGSAATIVVLLGMLTAFGLSLVALAYYFGPVDNRTSGAAHPTERPDV